MAYVPRPDALTHGVEYTNAQRSGLPAVAYALCEFIDNALLALRKSKEREPSLEPHINVLFVEPTWQYAQSQKMCILISDNGCGMNATTLESFARLVSWAHTATLYAHASHTHFVLIASICCVLHTAWIACPCIASC